MVNETLSVKSHLKTYNIHIGDGITHEIPLFVKHSLKQKRVFILADQQAAHFHLETLKQGFQKEEIECHILILPHGERYKDFKTLQNILHFLLEKQADRNDVLLAFGGGVTGDITGFAASILKRGVRFIQVPTTLLAQIDASIGGKTGINTPQGKNLIGSFYPPCRVYTDQIFLTTLSDRHIRCGYAEIAKAALIKDKVFFDWLCQHQNMFFTKDTKICHQAIVRAIQHKINITEKDEYEAGERAFLNFGHSFGHALEAIFKYSDILYHGEAVSIGMCMALRLSAELEESEITVAQSQLIEKELRKTGLPTRISDLKASSESPVTAENIFSYLQQDKKKLQGKLQLILLKRVGCAYIEKQVSPETLMKFLKQEVNGQSV